jgi:hypothetical protein
MKQKKHSFSSLTLFLTIVFSLSSFANNTQEQCQQIWKTMIDSSIPGNFETYKITSTIQSPQFSRKTVTINKTTVEESNDEVFITSNQTTVDGRSNPTSKTTMTKSQFLRSCVDGGFSNQKPEVLEEGQREVTVPAGTFSCRYQKIRMSQLVPGMQGIIISESYITQLPSGSTIMVKSTSESEMMMGMKNTVLQELIDYRR